MPGINEVFVLLLFVSLMALLAWASRVLPKEHWQFVATVPRRKLIGGAWDALNFTWYGALTAFSFVAACALVIVMTGAVGIAPELVLVSLIFLITLSLWSARAVAQWVEKIPGTHTIGGAVFVIVLVAPLVVMASSTALGFLTGSKYVAASQTLGMLAALAVSYAFGEGIGRIACISFGCCWGKRVDQLVGWQRWLFGRFHFVFDGHTKKIAYASQMAGVPVIPIQAITAAVHFLIGAISLWLFLRGMLGAALVVAMGGTQLWRFGSEFLRADFRGYGRITAYQWMALLCVFITIAYVWLFPHERALLKPDLMRGLKELWSPGPMICLQLLGLATFALMGKSSVTRASLRLRVVA